jgi:hypothetical protein
MAISIRKNDTLALIFYLLALVIWRVLLHTDTAVHPLSRIHFASSNDSLSDEAIGLAPWVAIGLGAWAGFRWVKIVFAVNSGLSALLHILWAPDLFRPPFPLFVAHLSTALLTGSVLLVIKDLLTRRSSAAPEERFGGRGMRG